MKYGLFWVAMGQFGVGFGPYGSKLVWKPIGPHLDPIWVAYGPVLAHFHVFGLLLDYCWPFPYCCPIPPVWGHCWRYFDIVGELLSMRIQRFLHAALSSFLAAYRKHWLGI